MRRQIINSLVIAVVFLFFIPSISGAATPVIFDHDGSSDDFIALIYQAKNPNFKLIGITVAGTGEVHGKQGAENTAAMTQFLGLPNVPIAYGRSKPLSSDGKPFPDSLRTMMDNLLTHLSLPKNPKAPISSDAVALLQELLAKSPDKVLIIATGPLTNIADLLIQFPQAKEKIERVVIMGGAIYVPGNIDALDPTSTNKVAEWNIYTDPMAAKILFESGVPVTLVPLDATNHVKVTREFYNSLKDDKDKSLNLAYELLKIILDEIGADVFFNVYYWWDPLAAMVAYHPELGFGKVVSLSVDLTNAQTILTNTGKNNVTITLDIYHSNQVLDKFLRDVKGNLKSC